MDWTAAIDTNRDALKRIVATLVAMVGSDAPVTLPRHFHRAVLRLLRPAESAARRLAIALARSFPTPSPPRPYPSGPAKARKAGPLLVRAGVGTGIVLRSGAPVPPHLAYLAPSKPAPRPLSFPLFDPLPR